MDCLTKIFKKVGESALKVWILQTGEPIHADLGSPRPMRAMNLANALVSRGHEVTLWTSLFNHQEKNHRPHSRQTITISSKLTIELIPSRGYSKNVGFERLVDHAQLSVNLRIALNRGDVELPKVAFVGYPPIEVAYTMIRWLKRRNIPTVIDVKDLWPQIFVEAFPSFLRPIARFFLTPYFYLGRRAISGATAVTSMTDAFLSELMAFSDRKRSPLDTVLPLSPKPVFLTQQQEEAVGRQWADRGLDLSHHQRFIFVGSLSRAFHFEPLFLAMSKLQQAYPDVELVICGSGEEAEELKEKFSKIHKAYFPGRIDNESISFLMKRSLATLAPYRNTPNFIKNFPNKIIDSLSYGVPVISGLNGEVQRYIQQYSFGIFCEGTGDSWYAAMSSLVADQALQERMSHAALRVYEKIFSFNMVYDSFVDKLELIANVRPTNR